MKRLRPGWPWGGLLIVLGIAISSVSLTIRVTQEANTQSGVSFIAGLALIVLSVVALVWIIFIYYWVRGGIRQRAVGRMAPDALMFEVVWGYLYLTVAVQADQLTLYRGSFRPINFLAYHPLEMQNITLRVVDLQTQTVTRHFLNIVTIFKPEAERPDLALLPVRTRLLVPARYSATQLGALGKALADKLGVPFVPEDT